MAKKLIVIGGWQQTKAAAKRDDVIQRWKSSSTGREAISYADVDYLFISG